MKPRSLRKNSRGLAMLSATAAVWLLAPRSSTSLQTWLNLGTATAATNGLAQFLDTNAPLFHARYYQTIPQ